jgi:putative FmdB family regulatory protein
MPIYEYTCRQCNEKFEHLARTMSAGDENCKCPKCGSAKTARELSVFAVRAEGAKSSSASSDMPMCGRCGEPGPCAMDD